MKILYFHQHFSTPSGSTGTRSYEFARYLVSKGHSVTIVCGQYRSADTGLKSSFESGRRVGVVDGIEVIEYQLPYSNSDSFLRRSFTFLNYSFKSLREVFTRDYDLLFATSTPLTAAIPGIVMKIFRRKKFVFEVRDLWPELPKAMGVIKNPLVLWMMDLLELLAYRLSDRCIGLSPGICKGIERRGVPASRIAMIPNGCDLHLFTPGTESKEIFSDPRITKDSFVAIFTGAHGIANGLDSVLDVAKVLLEKQRGDIFLVFIGEGREKAKLIRRTEAENLTNCIFLDTVSKTTLAGIMRASDVGLMILKDVPAFYYGTSPNKFFDYLAAGKPIVNNYPGWIADLITENHCGMAVPPGDSKAFADALIRLADDRAEGRVMGENSFKLAQEEFSRSRLAEEFESCLLVA